MRPRLALPVLALALLAVPATAASSSPLDGLRMKLSIVPLRVESNGEWGCTPAGSLQIARHQRLAIVAVEPRRWRAAARTPVGQSPPEVMIARLAPEVFRSLGVSFYVHTSNGPLLHVQVVNTGDPCSSAPAELLPGGGWRFPSAWRAYHANYTGRLIYQGCAIVDFVLSAGGRAAVTVLLGPKPKPLCPGEVPAE